MNTTYRIKDLKTGAWVSKSYAWKNRNRARARADKLDNAYGGYRYKVIASFKKTSYNALQGIIIDNKGV